ncbi:hypothetical protein WCX72_09865 [Sulfurimonas sp. HSL1-6]|uniref:hypothetical protein n=1 Tax=Sulfurimonadaceae TaxID=2771471 RepID=UPI0031F98943
MPAFNQNGTTNNGPTVNQLHGNAYFFSYFEEAHLDTKGMKDFKAITNYRLYEILYYVLAFSFVLPSVYAAEGVSKAIENDLSFMLFFPLFLSLGVVSSIFAIDKLAGHYSMTKVSLEKNIMTMKGVETDLVDSVYEVKLGGVLKKKVLLYQIRNDNGDVRTWEQSITFRFRAQANFFYRYVQYVQRKKMEQMMKKEVE